jgi:hypothetical protein
MLTDELKEYIELQFENFRSYYCHPSQLEETLSFLKSIPNKNYYEFRITWAGFDWHIEII